MSRLRSPTASRRTALACVVISSPFALHAVEAAELGCATNGITATFGTTFGDSLSSDENWYLIDGDPIKFAVGDQGGVAAWVCQPNGLTRQYYSEDAWGSVLWLDVVSATKFTSGYHGGSQFTPISHAQIDPWTIETVFAAGDGVQVRQTISYTQGELYVKKRWEISNHGGESYSDLRFFHGGDAYFGGSDAARSWWDPDLRMVYVNNENFTRSGIMGFYANPATPADHYFGGRYSAGNQQARSTGQLADTADSEYLDAGYHLQWNRSALRTGETWLIEAFETWTHPSPVQVIAPADLNTQADQSIVQTFKLHNLDATEALTIDLTAGNDEGWPVTLPDGSTVVVAPLERVSVPVTVTVPSGALPGATSATAVSAVVQGDGGAVNVSSARLSVIQINYEISPQSIDFGMVGLGSSATRTVTVTNSGAALVLGSIGNSDALAAPFSLVDGTDECSNATVATGESCTFMVEMAPSAEGSMSDSFNIPVLAPGTASHRIDVTGAGTVDPYTIDSDGDGMPDGYELEHGFDPFDPADAEADADGDGVSNAAEFAAGTNPHADDYPPVISLPQAVVIDATGLLTSLPALPAPSAYDVGDGEVRVTLVGATPYLAPGRHTLAWRAADAAGNEASVDQIVDVRPQISLGPDQVRAEGSTAQVRFILNGVSPSYPLNVDYIVGGTATPDDHDLFAGTVTFAEDEVEKAVTVQISADAVAEGAETIEVSLVGDGNFGAKRTHVLTIVEENVAPAVRLSIAQGSRPSRVIAANEGPVLIVAEVDDPNPQDRHTFEWWLPAGAAVGSVNAANVTLDPSSLAPGVYEIEVVVRDNGMPPKRTAAGELIRIIATAPELSDTADSDGDGIPDAQEGWGDANGNGIPDYLDANSPSNVLSEHAGDGGRYLIEAEPGLRLTLGALAAARNGGGASLSAEELIAAASPVDVVANAGGYFDFIMRGIPTPGASASIVIPQREPIPAEPVYRKLDGIWFTFVEDARNALASAPGQQGVCPPPGSEAYTPGLTPGDRCVRLTIEDGGPNDVDGEANGSIKDPGGVGMVGWERNETRGGGGDSGAGGGGAFGWPALLALLSLAALRRRAVRRPFRGGSQGAGAGAVVQRSSVARARLDVRVAGLLLGAVLVSASPQSEADDGAADARRASNAELAAAQAWWRSFYVAAGRGVADSRVRAAELEAEFAAVGTEARVVSIDTRRTSRHLAVGYRLSERWAVEAGDVDLGAVDVVFDARQLASELAVVHPTSGAGTVLSGVYRHPIGERLALRGRAGLFDWKSSYTTIRSEGAVDRYRRDDLDWLVGFGAAYRLSPMWGISGELQHYNLPGKPTRVLNVGFDWSFGALLPRR